MGSTKNILVAVTLLGALRTGAGAQAADDASVGVVSNVDAAGKVAVIAYGGGTLTLTVTLKGDNPQFRRCGRQVRPESFAVGTRVIDRFEAVDGRWLLVLEDPDCEPGRGEDEGVSEPSDAPPVTDAELRWEGQVTVLGGDNDVKSIGLAVGAGQWVWTIEWNSPLSDGQDRVSGEYARCGRPASFSDFHEGERVAITQRFPGHIPLEQVTVELLDGCGGLRDDDPKVGAAPMAGSENIVWGN